MKRFLAIVLAVVTVLSLFTTCLVSSTFAKYATTDSSMDSARVAKWGVVLQTNISGLFLDRYGVNDRNDVISFNGDDVVAPGTGNSINMNTSVTGVPEVAVEVVTSAKITLYNWEVNGNYYCPLVFTINGETKSGNEFESAVKFEKWIESRISKASAKYPPLTDLSAAEEIDLTISWSWPFEVDDDNDLTNGIANDVLDTALGNKAADDDIKNDPMIEISINQTVVQIDTYDFIIERDDDKIKFGSYPQTDVTNTTVATTLSAKVGNPTTNPSEWTSYGYYSSGVQSDYMWYTDVEEGGEKYRGVYFTEYRPFNIFASSDEYRYQQGNGYIVGNVYWFKYEPIFWSVLDKNTIDGTLLILCDMVIDSRHIDLDSNNYEQSAIREWLNADFYDTAFTQLQKELIFTTFVDNGLESTGDSSSDYICTDTNDNVFLLSVNDVTNEQYGFEMSLSASAIREKVTTDYTRAQGAITGMEGPRRYNGGWWLRSPNGEHSGLTRAVYGDGRIESNGVSNVDCGIVPALRIKL